MKSVRWNTYKTPTKKTDKSAIFFLVFNCKLCKTMMGMNSTAKSPTEFRALVAISGADRS